MLELNQTRFTSPLILALNTQTPNTNDNLGLFGNSKDKYLKAFHDYKWINFFNFDNKISMALFKTCKENAEMLIELLFSEYYLAHIHNYKYL